MPKDEAGRAGLDITFVTLLPTLTPRTGLGRAAAAAYAARSGLTDQEYLAQLGAPLTPAAAGSAVLDLLSADRSRLAAEYLLDGEGLHPLPS